MPDPLAQQQAVRTALAECSELFDPVIEAVAGYRQKCMGQGFSASAAEAMALDFHRIVLSQIAPIA